jgi:DtxR family Mn-dependent transcriptional regulator
MSSGRGWRYPWAVPTSTVEDYLKCILMAEEREPGSLVSMGHIGAALGVAPGTVTSMVKALADGGLVGYEPYSGVRLTPAGRQLAAHVLRRHRLVELFLVKFMGFGWSEVHAEAERLEHAVSDRLIERIDEMLGFPAVDPHGDPIPSAHGEVAEPALLNLLHAPIGGALRVARVTDQSGAFLRLLERQGLTPGARLAIEERDEAADSVALRLATGERLNLGFRAASKILVEPGAPTGR